MSTPGAISFTSPEVTSVIGKEKAGELKASSSKKKRCVYWSKGGSRPRKKRAGDTQLYLWETFKKIVFHEEKCVNQLSVAGHNTWGNEFTKKKWSILTHRFSSPLWAAYSGSGPGWAPTPLGRGKRFPGRVEGTRTHEVTSFLRDPPLKASSAFQLL